MAQADVGVAQHYVRYLPQKTGWRRRPPVPFHGGGAQARRLCYSHFHENHKMSDATPTDARAMGSLKTTTTARIESSWLGGPPEVLPSLKPFCPHTCKIPPALWQLPY